MVIPDSALVYLPHPELLFDLFLPCVFCGCIVLHELHLLLLQVAEVLSPELFWVVLMDRRRSRDQREALVDGRSSAYLLGQLPQVLDVLHGRFAGSLHSRR